VITSRSWELKDAQVLIRRHCEGQERTEDRFRDQEQIESSDALLAHGDEPIPQHALDETYQGMRLRLTRSSEPPSDFIGAVRRSRSVYVQRRVM
jgi:hypothetical protein